MQALRKADFSLAANIASRETEIATYTVPYDKALKLLNNMPLSMFLGAKDLFSGNGTTTQFTLTNDFVDSPNLGDDGGSVYGFVGGTRASISAVSYPNNTVTFASAPGSGTNNVAVYYIFAGGYLKIVATPPDTESRRKSLYNKLIKVQHENDQYDSYSAFKLKSQVNYPGVAADILRGAAEILPEDFRLRVLVNSAIVVNTDANNLAYDIALPCELVPMSKLPTNIKQLVVDSMIG